MGLFNVNMPTLYGEGRRAFYRLQQEVMKQSVGTSLFCWGDCFNLEGGTQVTLREVYKLLDNSMNPHFFLLATSLKDFQKPLGRSVRYTPSATEPLQPYLEWQWKAKNVRRDLGRL